jgi:hypothetical protein
MNTAAKPSSTEPTSSMLPPSSSTFSIPPNRGNTYRIEEPEHFHNNSKGDIAD